MQDGGLENLIGPELEKAAIKPETKEISKLCKFLMKNHWSTVTFKLQSTNAMRLYQDVKVTFSDKIATFGRFF